MEKYLIKDRAFYKWIKKFQLFNKFCIEVFLKNQTL